MSPAPLAVLPMYDLPELRAATDRLWAALRDALRARGVVAPEALDRATPPMRAWLSPGLALGQTCGLPYATRLASRVALIGAPDYGIEGCPPGFYTSALVVRTDDAREGLEAFAGAIAAIGEIGSQSGHAALLHAAAPQARDRRFFAGLRLTGSHRASIRAVAAGLADIAAIDAVTWRLARRHDPAAARLRMLAQTEPTPGLPFISARDADADAIATACAAAIATLDAGTRDLLGLQSFVRFRPADYAPLAARFAGAENSLDLPPPMRCDTPPRS